MMGDPYETGTPKYKYAQDIYDGLQALTSGEEIGILSEMFTDVSYDGQDYYYQDKGAELEERFDELSDYGNKMWLIELAILQMDKDEIHNTVYEALYNSDLAKRLGFRKLFIEHLLRGDSSQYDEISEEFYYELQELNNFQWHQMNAAYMRVMEKHGRKFYGVYPYEYGSLCTALADRVQNLHLHKETQLVAECRSFLTSYDDFILGLRMNQELYNMQERQLKRRIAELETAYDERLQQLFIMAQQQGVILGKTPEPILIESRLEVEEGNEILAPLIQIKEQE